MTWLQQLPHQSGDIQPKWSCFSPIGQRAQSYGRLWESCNSLVAMLSKQVKSSVISIDSILTVANWFSIQNDSLSLIRIQSSMQ
jgi:hypothetical protein